MRRAALMALRDLHVIPSLTVGVLHAGRAERDGGRYAVRPWRKDIASSAASRMCWSRMRSVAFILEQGRGNHLVTEVTAQLFRRTQVDFPADDLRKFHLHPDQIEIGYGRFRLELHQKIHVAFRPEARRQYRAEQGEFEDAMPLAEVVDRGLGHGDGRGGSGPSVCHGEVAG